MIHPTTKPRILLVHGTFSPNAPWTLPTSPLSKSLKNRLGDVDIVAVEWGGRNTFKAREEAGQKIIAELATSPPGSPLAIIAHSHGGSAVAYAMRARIDLFEPLRAVVCLATPFFGFSVRPGYHSLLFSLILTGSFLLFQATLAIATIVGRKLSPRFDEEPYLIAAIGSALLLCTVFVGRHLWQRRLLVYRVFEQVIESAARWDTTQVQWKCALFVRSMGDEVGLGFSTLQFASTILNKVVNVIALIASRALEFVVRWGSGWVGRTRVVLVLLPLIVVSALPAAMAANFGYHPKFWTDILNPWSTTFTFVEPTFSAPDHGARIAYAMALAVIAMPTLLAVVYTLAVLIALVLSWLATGALGCLSWRMAIATQWAVEPAPEGKHAFFNGGWTRDALALERDRAGLQHSEPYTSPAVVEAVVEFVVEGFRTGADRPHDA